MEGLRKFEPYKLDVIPAIFALKIELFTSALRFL